MTELEEEAEKGEDSQTGKASDNNTQVPFLQDRSSCHVTCVTVRPSVMFKICYINIL
jgi:hypothetical protein